MKKGAENTQRVVYGDNVYRRKPLPDFVRTRSLYMPQRTLSKDMTLMMARRGLCHKCGGDINVCRKCPAPCAMGKRCMELTQEEQA